MLVDLEEERDKYKPFRVHVFCLTLLKTLYKSLNIRVLIDWGEIFIQPTLKQCDKVLCVRKMLCSSVVSVCVRETDHLPEQNGNKQKIQTK